MGKIIVGGHKIDYKAVKKIKGKMEKKIKRPGNVKFCKKSKSNINDLSDPILLKIFSYVPQIDLFNNIRLVCKHWFKLSSNQCLWKSIIAGPEIPSNILIKWLENATQLEKLKVRNRNDGGEILKTIVKYNTELKEFKMHNCWGSDFRENIPSAPLCNVLTRCPYLKSISLYGTKFISRKFFRVLASRDLILEKRKRKIDHSRRAKNIRYTGPLFKKQIRAYFNERLVQNLNKRVILSMQFKPKADDYFDQEVFVESKNDIEKLINAIPM